MSIARALPAIAFQHCAVVKGLICGSAMEISIPASGSGLDRTAVMQALGDPLRWKVLALLADGKPLSVSDLATGTQRDPDLISKHLRVLRDAGAVTVGRDASKDARRQLYAVPERFRVTAGVIDFGFCLLRFG